MLKFAWTKDCAYKLKHTKFNAVKYITKQKEFYMFWVQPLGLLVNENSKCLDVIAIPPVLRWHPSSDSLLSSACNSAENVFHMTFIAYTGTCYVLFSLIRVVITKVALLICQKVSWIRYSELLSLLILLLVKFVNFFGLWQARASTQFIENITLQKLQNFSTFLL